MKHSLPVLVFFHETGHTPNMVTTYAFALKLATLLFLWNHHVMGVILSYMGAYYLDCMDGTRWHRVGNPDASGHQHWHDSITKQGTLVFYDPTQRSLRPVQEITMIM